MFRPGIITGLRSEAACFQRGSKMPALDIMVAAANSKRAESMARELVDAGCSCLISFGIAGALSPDLSPGQLILPEWVVDSNGARIDISGDLRIGLKNSLSSDIKMPRTSPSSMFGSDAVLRTSNEKVNSRNKTGADAVDMESHGVGRVAKFSNLPFLIVRAICDRSNTDLPRSALGSIDEYGNPRIIRTIGKALARPSDIPGLISLGAQSRAAHQTLRRVAPLIVSGLDF